MKHAGTKTIETARLILRRLELTDAEMMFRNWTGDDKVTRFLRWDAHTKNKKKKNMIQQWVDNYQYDSTYYWGMYLKKGTDSACALARIFCENSCWQPPHSEQFPIEKNSEMIGSIGVTITSEYDFKGELGYKIGMLYEGLIRHYYKTRDGFHDCALYGIIRNEWA